MVGNRIQPTTAMVAAMLVAATTMGSTYWGTAIAETTTGNDGDIATCGTSLIPCGRYLNSTTTPPSSCCHPLKQALSTEKTCLCSILNGTSLLTSLGINVTQALTIPTRCGITTGSDANICDSGPPPTSAPQPPPGKNMAERIAWTGITILLTLWVVFLTSQ